jgi:aminoglycoside phosphotransferase (APT) family kinase protein
LHESFVRSDEVARRYADRSGFDLSDLPYYAVFSWWKQACIVEGVYARRLGGATGGAGPTTDPSAIARRVDTMLERAAELADGVI